MARPKSAPERLSISAYARRLGLADTSIHEAIKAGRIVKGYGRDTRNRPYILPEIADREWAANTDPTAVRDTITGNRATAGNAPDQGDAPPVPSRTNANQSKATHEYYKAEKARIEVEQLLGQLVPIGDVKATVAAEYTAVRQRLLGIPSRVCAELALLDTPAEVRRALTAAIEDALNELAADDTLEAAE